MTVLIKVFLTSTMTALNFFPSKVSAVDEGIELRKIFPNIVTPVVEFHVPIYERQWSSIIMIIQLMLLVHMINNSQTC